jgi:hypothetical protein
MTEKRRWKKRKKNEKRTMNHREREGEEEVKYSLGRKVRK